MRARELTTVSVVAECCSSSEIARQNLPEGITAVHQLVLPPLEPPLEPHLPVHQPPLRSVSKMLTSLVDVVTIAGQASTGIYLTRRLGW